MKSNNLSGLEEFVKPELIEDYKMFTYEGLINPDFMNVTATLSVFILDLGGPREYRKTPAAAWKANKKLLEDLSELEKGRLVKSIIKYSVAGDTFSKWYKKKERD
ncbi:MAG: hypothetical protein WC476_00870 [Phycisphaerae bacterium]|jgi:hypothetical protein